MQRETLILTVFVSLSLLLAGCTTDSPPTADTADNRCQPNDNAKCQSTCAESNRVDNHYCAGGNKWCCFQSSGGGGGSGGQGFVEQ